MVRANDLRLAVRRGAIALTVLLAWGQPSLAFDFAANRYGSSLNEQLGLHGFKTRIYMVDCTADLAPTCSFQASQHVRIAVTNGDTGLASKVDLTVFATNTDAAAVGELVFGLFLTCSPNVDPAEMMAAISDLTARISKAKSVGTESSLTLHGVDYSFRIGFGSIIIEALDRSIQ